MKRLSWKYIAGFIDGEGCIDLQISSYKGDQYRTGIYIRPRLRICLAAVGKEVLDIMQTNFGGNMSLRKSKNSNWNDSYCWSLDGYKLACPFIRNIKNHLIIKKEQAELTLWLETHVKGKRFETEQIPRLIQEEFKVMKRDPHRLSEKAVISLTDAIVELGN